jgi:hypothetical protein
VLYGGNEVFDLQVTETFWNDLRLSFFAVAAIIVLMLILTSFSIWLTIFGLVTIVLSFPLAFFFYRVVFNIVSLGILNGVAAFVIVGIGQYLLAFRFSSLLQIFLFQLNLSEPVDTNLFIYIYIISI